MEFVMANKAVILGALFAISEVLALIPSVKANGIFQGIFKVLQGLTKKEAE